jgi:hypothetical protein
VLTVSYVQLLLAMLKQLNDAKPNHTVLALSTSMHNGHLSVLLVTRCRQHLFLSPIWIALVEVLCYRSSIAWDMYP